MPDKLSVLLKYGERLKDDLRRFLLLNENLERLARKNPDYIDGRLIEEHEHTMENIVVAWHWLNEVELQSAEAERTDPIYVALKEWLFDLFEQNYALCTTLAEHFQQRSQELKTLLQTPQHVVNQKPKAFDHRPQPKILDLRQ